MSCLDPREPKPEVLKRIRAGIMERGTRMVSGAFREEIRGEKCHCLLGAAVQTYMDEHPDCDLSWKARGVKDADGGYFNAAIPKKVKLWFTGQSRHSPTHRCQPLWQINDDYISTHGDGSTVGHMQWIRDVLDPMIEEVEAMENA